MREEMIFSASEVFRCKFLLRVIFIRRSKFFLIGCIYMEDKI